MYVGAVWWRHRLVHVELNTPAEEMNACWPWLHALFAGSVLMGLLYCFSPS
ncbi:MAG: hypothetical protein ACLUEK_16305 [Oscillospiraceae bacterium]